MKKRIRYLAEWITRQSDDDAADCDYEVAECASLAAAKAMALTKSKNCNVVEWCAAEVEENYMTKQRWTGDWSCNWELVQSN
jgi:hypothetical protein